MKSLLILATALLAVTSAPAQDWAKARLDQSPRHLEWITVKHDGREVGCYVGYPERKDKAPAVLIIHEIYGLSDWARSVVDEFAAAGYVAIAPDLLWGEGAKGGGTDQLTSSEIGQKIHALPSAQITADLDAAAAYITQQPGCNGKIAVIGFCWGGGQSFRYATNNPKLEAAFVCYGTPPAIDDMAKIQAPVYGFYAGNDARVSATVPKTIEQMKQAGKPYESAIYDGAGHGFMRAGEAPDASPANKAAHDAAWKRIKEVLAKI